MSVKFHSDERRRGVHIDFPNGVTVSIVQGIGAERMYHGIYSGDDTAEAAAWSRDHHNVSNNWLTSAWSGYTYDDVVGWLDSTQLAQFIAWAASLKQYEIDNIIRMRNDPDREDF